MEHTSPAAATAVESLESKVMTRLGPPMKRAFKRGLSSSSFAGFKAFEGNKWMSEEGPNVVKYDPKEPPIAIFSRFRGTILPLVMQSQIFCASAASSPCFPRLLLTQRSPDARHHPQISCCASTSRSSPSTSGSYLCSRWTPRWS